MNRSELKNLLAEVTLKQFEATSKIYKTSQAVTAADIEGYEEAGVSSLYDIKEADCVLAIVIKNGTSLNTVMDAVRDQRYSLVTINSIINGLVSGEISSVRIKGADRAMNEINLKDLSAILLTPIQRVKQSRLAKKMSQSDVAKLTGIDQRLISQYEQGLVQPSTEKLTKMAIAVGADIGNIITDYADLLK